VRGPCGQWRGQLVFLGVSRARGGPIQIGSAMACAEGELEGGSKNMPRISAIVLLLIMGSACAPQENRRVVLRGIEQECSDDGYFRGNPAFDNCVRRRAPFLRVTDPGY
jgi:hypothetical protein